MPLVVGLWVVSLLEPLQDFALTNAIVAFLIVFSLFLFMAIWTYIKVRSSVLCVGENINRWDRSLSPRQVLPRMCVERLLVYVPD